MFVTSDVFDLRVIGRYQGFDWRENLLCGVLVHGTVWRGYAAAASYLLAAARCSRNLNEIKYASYGRPGGRRQHSIKPTSFDRLAKGELAGARNADSVLLRGQRLAAGAQGDHIIFGGEATGGDRFKRTATGPTAIACYPFHAFDADFWFPLCEDAEDVARELFRLSIDVLDAEYAYLVIRDGFALPMGYCWGISAALDHGRLSDIDASEIGEWRDYVGEGRLWTDPFPLLRDLFAINLISARHTSVCSQRLGYLTDWIRGAAGRGQLEDLGRGRLLWTLTDQEIFDVRPVLNEAGLLKSCQDRIYRDLHPGTGLKPYAEPWCYQTGRWRGLP